MTNILNIKNIHNIVENVINKYTLCIVTDTWNYETNSININTSIFDIFKINIEFCRYDGINGISININGEQIAVIKPDDAGTFRTSKITNICSFDNAYDYIWKITYELYEELVNEIVEK